MRYVFFPRTGDVIQEVGVVDRTKCVLEQEMASQGNEVDEAMFEPQKEDVVE